ncbi:MAG: NADH dehydrogenase FAD-containing subunit [Chloroflexi bacterium]|jgi:peroxiredoxin family protein|nr:NADH dehydrogenase FAD-containing subunit [Chloroflexota bacterium]
MDSNIDVLNAPDIQFQLHSLSEEVAALKKQVKDQQQENSVNVICFSGEWDRLFASLTIAGSALAMGMQVHLFFTFWAVSALRGDGSVKGSEKSFLQTMFGRMLPSGPGKAPLSKFNFGGLGKCLMRRIMKQNNIEDIDVLFQEVVDLGAQIHVCETSSILFGLGCDELINGDQIDRCGAATFLSQALKSRMTLFI